MYFIEMHQSTGVVPNSDPCQIILTPPDRLPAGQSADSEPVCCDVTLTATDNVQVHLSKLECREKVHFFL